jgi:hypothetical protein
VWGLAGLRSPVTEKKLLRRGLEGWSGVAEDRGGHDLRRAGRRAQVAVAGGCGRRWRMGESEAASDGDGGIGGGDGGG